MPKKEVKGDNTMQFFMQEFEHFTDHIIPYLVVALAVVLLLENPLWTIVHLHDYEPWITIFDSAVVFFFVADLAFKWVKTKNVRRFLKLYWLDIIAVFPFYLGFRAYSEFAGFFFIGEELTETGQKVAHEAVLLREARQARAVGRNIRFGQRILRALKGRLYASHNALMAVHSRHKREHSISR